MKLKNRKTGETGTLFQHGEGAFYELWVSAGGKRCDYTSLARLNEDWEDYEERCNGYYYLTSEGKIIFRGFALRRWGQIDDNRKEIGNYFKTKEEAEEAVEKLKAWKQLKDRGFKNICWTAGVRVCAAQFRLGNRFWEIESKHALDLLFGGEE